MTTLLNFGVFKELKDLTYFKKVKLFMGTVSWPHGQDICRDTLYIEGEAAAQVVDSEVAEAAGGKGGK